MFTPWWPKELHRLRKHWGLSEHIYILLYSIIWSKLSCTKLLFFRQLHWVAPFRLSVVVGAMFVLYEPRLKVNIWFICNNTCMDVLYDLWNVFMCLKCSFQTYMQYMNVPTALMFQCLLNHNLIQMLQILKPHGKHFHLFTSTFSASLYMAED